MYSSHHLWVLSWQLQQSHLHISNAVSICPKASLSGLLHRLLVWLTILLILIGASQLSALFLSRSCETFWLCSYILHKSFKVRIWISLERLLDDHSVVKACPLVECKSGKVVARNCNDQEYIGHGKACISSCTHPRPTTCSHINHVTTFYWYSMTMFQASLCSSAVHAAILAYRLNSSDVLFKTACMHVDDLLIHILQFGCIALITLAGVLPHPSSCLDFRWTIYGSRFCLYAWSS